MGNVNIFYYVIAIMLVCVGIASSANIMRECLDAGMEAFGVICSIVILLAVGLGSIYIVWVGVTSTKIEDNIESALNKNYAGYTNYHNGNAHTFVYDGKKYSFEYDYDTNTLVVFNETGTVIDGTYVDGQKMDDTGKTDINEIVSETELESKVPDTSVDTKKSDSAPVSENNSDLNRRIQTAIFERYTDVLITSYDSNTLSGTFESAGFSYKFAWSDNLLEIAEINNPNNIIYMKIQK